VEEEAPALSTLLPVKPQVKLIAITGDICMCTAMAKRVSHRTHFPEPVKVGGQEFRCGLVNSVWVMTGPANQIS
jgi:hypothetical protein